MSNDLTGASPVDQPVRPRFDSPRLGDSELYAWLYDRCEKARTLAATEGISDQRKRELLDEAQWFMVAGMAVIQRDEFRELLAEWNEGMYSGGDFLRRVRLALHGHAGLSLVRPNDRNEGRSPQG